MVRLWKAKVVELLGASAWVFAVTLHDVRV
jgi:hypothetical protein